MWAILAFKNSTYTIHCCQVTRHHISKKIRGTISLCSHNYLIQISFCIKEYLTQLQCSQPLPRIKISSLQLLPIGKRTTQAYAPQILLLKMINWAQILISLFSLSVGFSLTLSLSLFFPPIFPQFNRQSGWVKTNFYKLTKGIILQPLSVFKRSF